MRNTLQLIRLMSVCVFYLFGCIASASVLPDAAESNDYKSWYFIAFLDDTPVGHHYFEVNIKNNETSVYSQADFDVRFLFISVYRYKHKNNEVWTGHCLNTLKSATDINGDNQFVSLYKQNNVVHVESTDATYEVNQCVRSFAYWNLDLLKTNKLLNSQTGELLTLDFEFVKNEVLDIKNKQVNSLHYQLKGKDRQGIDIEIDLWYSVDKQWLALRSKLENGSYLRYQLEEKLTARGSGK